MNNYRVLAHQKNDNINIGAAFSSPSLEFATNLIIDSYTLKFGDLIGDFYSTCEKYFTKLAIVNADTLEVMQTIYPKEEI